MREPVNQVHGTNLINFGTILDVRFLIRHFWSLESSFAFFNWRFGFIILVSSFYDIKSWIKMRLLQILYIPRENIFKTMMNLDLVCGTFLDSEPYMIVTQMYSVFYHFRPHKLKYPAPAKTIVKIHKTTPAILYSTFWRNKHFPVDSLMNSFQRK